GGDSVSDPEIWMAAGEIRATRGVNTSPSNQSARTGSPSVGLVGEQCVEVAALPQTSLFVKLETSLICEKRLGVKLAPAVLHADVVDLVQHLVEHDPRDEEPRHELAIERAMDPDQAIFDGVAPHLDRVAAARPAGPRAPRDRGLDA